MDKNEVCLSSKIKIIDSRQIIKISVKIKMKNGNDIIQVPKIYLSLEDFLNRYYLKEWIQDDLREMNLSPTGSKEDLSYRLLDALRRQGKTVHDVAFDMISSVPSEDLENLAKELGITVAENEEDLIDGIFSKVEFEPFVTVIERFCETCGKETEQEIHFDNNWKQEVFVCSICGFNDFVTGMRSKVQKSTVEQTKANDNVTSAAGTVFGVAITVFLSFLFGLKSIYGWPIAIILSVLVTILAALCMIYFRPYWERYLIDLLNRTGEK